MKMAGKLPAIFSCIYLFTIVPTIFTFYALFIHIKTFLLTCYPHTIKIL